MHLSAKSSNPPWLKKAFPDQDSRAAFINVRAQVLVRFIDATERQAVFWGKQDQVKRQREFFRSAGAKVPAIMNQREITRRLRSLGGRKARLRRQATELAEKRGALLGARHYQFGFESWKIEREMRSLKALSKIYGSNPRLDVEQQYWHHLQVLLHQSLPAEGTMNERRRYVRYLCKWLSVPEIDLNCTPDTIKAARKHLPRKPPSPVFRQTPNWTIYRPRSPITPAMAINEMVEAITKETDPKEAP